MENVICKNCNKEFVGRRVDRRKFCSRSCASLFNVCIEKLRERGRLGGLKLKGTKKSKEAIMNMSIAHKKTFQTKNIWNKGLTAKMDNRIVCGEKQWKWKGGISDEDERQRVKFKRTIQKAVFKRDNYTCQMCGSKGDLQVDHIQPWSEYVALRFSMDNCRTLCVKCHYLITFGKPMPQSTKTWGHNLSKGGVFP